MTDLSSTDEAGERSGRSTVPAPPRPPGAVDTHDDVGTGLFTSSGPGPATAAMPPVPTDGTDADELIERGYPVGRPAPPSGADGYTGIGHLPPVTGVAAAQVAPPAPPRVGRGFQRGGRVTVRGPRRAKLVLRRIDPWTVLKFSFLFSICLLIVWVVAVGALFSLLRTMHVFDNINQVLASATSDPTSKGVHIDPKSHDVTLWAAILGAVNALLFTALATLGAFLYNLIAMLVGGVEVTLAERD